MFTDVSGFTNLTESLSKLGNEGPELTAFVKTGKVPHKAMFMIYFTHAVNCWGFTTCVQ